MSTRATLLGVDGGFFKSPRVSGTVFNVAFGRNYDGEEEGQIVAIKWVRPEHHCHAHHFTNIRKVCDIAAEIVAAFMKRIKTKGWTISVLKPTVWKSDEEKGKRRTVLVERYISDFTKFNCNSGWADKSERTHNKIIQALSHFSYEWSKEKFVLCDLQGGVNEEKKTIVLSDPCIVSVEGGRYGCTDIGKDGLSNFFRYHRCTSYCRHMVLPKHRKILFRPVKSTLYN